MNPTEIFDALDALGQAAFNPNEFGYAFAEATDNAKATVSKLRNGSTNKSDLPGGVLLNGRFHFAPAPKGEVARVLDAIRASKRTEKGKPAILLATDGDTVAAEHPRSGESLHCAFTELGAQFAFFLPAAGKERYRAVEENPVDVKATGKLAKLYDALLKRNPDWGTEARRHDMNLFMTRLVFCLFAEDVGIFPAGQFSDALGAMSGDRGEHARATLVGAFAAMNLPKEARQSLPGWAADFEYVNGGLFAGNVDAPEFDAVSLRYLRDACALDWKLINPDIFGSMIQSIADADQRSELGMHYTSVPNIMKVIGPLFLDELDEAIARAWDRKKDLGALLLRLGRIRVFDPACGSGNFLVVAYRQLRERETRVLQRLAELGGGATQMAMFSGVSLGNFYGIEINDFAAETAKLSLFIAEYQANARLAEVIGQMPPLLPLRAGGRITYGNSLRLDWEAICPHPNDGSETFIAGNPPYLGGKKQSNQQKEDMEIVFGRGNQFKNLDYISAFFMKAVDYIQIADGCAFVTTSSICQGTHVPTLWPKILSTGVKISFCHTPFKWSNNAANNAGVFVSIVGLTKNKKPGRIFDGETRREVCHINSYLIDSPELIVQPESEQIFGLARMITGNAPYDGGHLFIDDDERMEIIKAAPEAGRLFRRVTGAAEFNDGSIRWCIWVDDCDRDFAYTIPKLKERFKNVASSRLEGGDVARTLTERPHQFRYRHMAQDHVILVPQISGENRQYLPVGYLPADYVVTHLAHCLYDGGLSNFSILSSKLHQIWLRTIAGRLGNGIRYTSNICWNTFPVPAFSADQKEALTKSAKLILKTRAMHYPATIADLYDPDKMPDDLREVHRANDALLESMYIGRPFKNDTERLEHLFKLYAAKVKQLQKAVA